MGLLRFLGSYGFSWGRLGYVEVNSCVLTAYV